MKIAKSEVVREVEAAGFHLVKEFDFLVFEVRKSKFENRNSKLETGSWKLETRKS